MNDPVPHSLCSAGFNKCTRSPSPALQPWTTLTTPKTFPASLLQIKTKKCHVGKLSWLTKIHKYYLFLQNYLSMNLINFFTVKEITWVCDKNVKLGFQYRRQLCIDIVLLFLFGGNTERHIALNLITLSKY